MEHHVMILLTEKSGSAGFPGRGMSESRSLMDSSVSGMLCKLLHRPRQVRTVFTFTFSSLAISAFLFPPTLPQVYFGLTRQLFITQLSQEAL